MSKAALIGGGLVAWAIYARATTGNKYARPEPAKSSVFDFLSIDWGVKMNQPNLRYFKKEEFGKWWPDMSTDLLAKLDDFRFRIGAPVTISPVEGAIGRNGGLSTSQHNVDLWGEVRAVDVQIPAYINLKIAYAVARDVGFTGIGVYPDWKPSHGLHLDVRPKALALWSGFWNDKKGKNDYFGINKGLA